MEVCQNFTDRSCAFKGKRTKRSRPSSPLCPTGRTTTVATSSSSIAGGSDDDGGGDFYNSTIQYSSPTTSTTQFSTTSTSEEDEDMANCLILLAQSGCGQKVQDVSEVKKEKISSRKFTEMATCTNGKAGFYVYECKTCNRTFPSFQALGGHRASHKKPKTIVEEKKSVTINTDTAATPTTHDSHDHHLENDHEQGRLNRISTTHSNQITVNNKTKIHECSICGSEFSSGQALGGHMRRHRPPPTTMITASNVSESSSCYHDEKTTRNVLSLDLNLPAPPEDDHKFEQSLVFSAAPLVDCYY
ncbi:zinc finger protein ZAT5 [Solanum dulcamara]|uniref:zinc finger protein ZAT5 n=1 Tax=Solanum dulcamara TaxID=45834 RepID=UPI00248579F6|nr:zinc finger protein ZAT5 [Solanum dulcamara]